MKRLLLVSLCAVSLYGADPTTTSVSPNLLSIAPGVRQVFTWVVTDTDGGSTIATIYALINVGASNVNACYVIWSRSANTITLQDGVAGGLTPGGGTTDEHTYCKVYMTGSSVVTAGNTVTLKVDTEFKAPFSSVGASTTKNLFLAVVDNGPGTFVGFNDMGDVTILGTPTTYYVDFTGGLDTNAGTSTGLAWKTANKVNTSTFNPGDYVLFKCGEVWREQLIPPSSGANGSPITFGNYGTGTACTSTNRPLFVGSNAVPTGWTLQSGSIYQNTAITWTPVRVAYADGVRLVPKSSLAGVTAAGQFYFNDAANTIYVWIAGGGTPNGHTMEVGARPGLHGGLVSIGTHDYLTFSGLELLFSNWHGFWDYGGDGITVQDCKITYNYSNAFVAIGITQGAPTDPNNITFVRNEANHGGYRRIDELVFVDSAGQLAGAEVVNVDSSNGFTLDNNILNDWYGEGLCAVFAAKNGTINDNTISNMQIGGAVYITGSGGKFAGPNIEMARNVMTGGIGPGAAMLVSVEGSGTIDGVNAHHNVVANYPNGVGLQIGNDNNPPGAATVTNSHYRNNTVYGTLHGLFFGTNANFANNSWRNNIVYVTGNGNALEWAGQANGTGNVFNNNQYYVPSNPTNTFIWIGGAANTFAAFASATGQEAAGNYANPLFTNTGTSDFTLQSTSPAIGRGLAVSGIKQERYGAAPDSGAYEYAPGKLGTLRTSMLRNRYKAAIFP